MSGTTKIALDNITRFLKRLRDLPVKDTRKSREEAEVLRKTMEKKGYSLKEIRAMLKEEHIPIPVSMLKQHLEGEQKIPSRLPLKKIAADAPKTETLSAEGITIKPDTPDEEL